MLQVTLLSTFSVPPLVFPPVEIAALVIFLVVCSYYFRYLVVNAKGTHPLFTPPTLPSEILALSLYREILFFIINEKFRDECAFFCLSVALTVFSFPSCLHSSKANSSEYLPKKSPG